MRELDFESEDLDERYLTQSGGGSSFGPPMHPRPSMRPPPPSDSAGSSADVLQVMPFLIKVGDLTGTVGQCRGFLRRS
jgi:hypothetical protein